MLKHEPSLTILNVDTAENGPKVDVSRNVLLVLLILSPDLVGLIEVRWIYLGKLSVDHPVHWMCQVIFLVR